MSNDGLGPPGAPSSFLALATLAFCMYTEHGRSVELAEIKREIRLCGLDRGPAGVLDSIRICLGVVRSTALQRGQHEVFELFHTKTLGPPHLKSNHGKSSKTKPSKTAKSEVDVFSAEDPMVEYLHRTVRLSRCAATTCITRRMVPDLTLGFMFTTSSKTADRWLDVAHGYFVCRGRTESEGDVRNFIGPYALKLYNADCGSDCFKDDLIQLARDGQAKNVLLPTCGFLVQSANYDEFVKAFIDFVEGIASLAEKDLLHRDLSIGNVLLSKDIACSPSFLSDAAASAQAILGTSVAFTQRTLEQRIGRLIHDFDMAGRAHPPPEMATGESGSEADLLTALLKTNKQAERPASSAQPGGPRKGFRTGTPPFMAIRLLIDAPPPISLPTTLLFVLVLFFWSYPTFLTDIPFPKPVPAQSRKWPPEVLRWANRPVGFSLAELGVLKRGFFQKPLTLRDTLDRTLDGDLWTQDPAFLRFFWALYGALWTRSHEGPDWVDRFYVTAGDVQKVLTTEYVTTCILGVHFRAASDRAELFEATELPPQIQFSFALPAHTPEAFPNAMGLFFVCAKRTNHSRPRLGGPPRASFALLTLFLSPPAPSH
ncbi:hypothetical protein B0H14DRAFT_3522930 [Mycena olivaceomarginata]|nr:hypothetical protein B0H14DRAFT_3522930 [Mycena olivaceomarginata]